MAALRFHVRLMLMRSIRLGAVLALGVTALAPAQAAGPDWAKGLFTEQGHDFGPVPRGAVVRHNFVIQNRTNELINIVDVRASCGCTTGRALVQTLQPGQSGVVEAQMDTRNFVGNKATTLTVTLITSSGRQSEVKLGVRSMILSDIVLNPGVVDFGVVTRGQAVQQVITIDRAGAPAWRADRMMASRQLGAAISAELVETGRSPQGVGYRLTVALRPDAPPGLYREEIRILTNDRESPTLPVLVTAEIRGELSASPALLTMGRISSAQPVQGRYLIRGVKPFAIAGIEGQGDGFELTAAEPNARKTLHVVTLTYHPEKGTSRGDLRKTFRVLTDLPGEPALELNAAVQVD